ncbi:MAG: hypothetical protein OXH70_17190 [Acidobacteria bacterium]|nr:hypothetical protein [Acidobacteriota bacterium]
MAVVFDDIEAGFQGQSNPLAPLASRLGRMESIAFANVSEIPQGGPDNVELSPKSTNPVSLLFGAASAEAMISGVAGRDFTIAAGMYAVFVQGVVDTNTGNDRTFRFDIRNASNNSVLVPTSASFFSADDKFSFISFSMLALAAPLSVNVQFRGQRFLALEDPRLVVVSFTRE